MLRSVTCFAALAMLASWTGAKNSSVNDDVARDSGDARLRQLSDEISRIAATLARLSTGPAALPAEKPEPAVGDAPTVSLESVRQVHQVDLGTGQGTIGGGQIQAGEGGLEDDVGE